MSRSKSRFQNPVSLREGRGPWPGRGGCIRRATNKERTLGEASRVGEAGTKAYPNGRYVEERQRRHGPAIGLRSRNKGFETGSKSRGFTLLEVVLALVLLVSGIAASTYLFGRGMYAAVDSESVTQAAALAQEKLEQLRGNSFTSVVSEAKAAISGWAGFSREVAVSQPAATNSDFKQVAVTVYWDSNEGELSVSLTTYVADVDNA